MSTHLSFGKDLSRCFGCRSNDTTGEMSLSTLFMTISATIKAAVVLVIPTVVAAANEIKTFHSIGKVLDHTWEISVLA